jgi:Fur family transcriptional regulator, peroxide stress response regulator
MDNTLHLAQSLRKAGLRLTPQRLAICRFLANTDKHPTAQMIYDEVRPQFPTLSLATVYNTLDALVQLGMINTLGGTGSDAERYDADTSPHVNLSCVSCQRVVDFPSHHLHALEDEVASQSKYRLLGSRFLFFGLCPECQAKSEGSSGLEATEKQEG